MGFDKSIVFVRRGVEFVACSNSGSVADLSKKENKCETGERN